MSEPEHFFGLPRDEFSEWLRQRGIDSQYERNYFAGIAPLPEGQEVPPNWVKKANKKLGDGLTAALAKAIKGLRKDIKDYYSWGVFMGSIHAFREQIPDILRNVDKQYREELGSPEEQTKAFIAALTPDKYWGMGQWKARLFFARLKLMLMTSFIQPVGQSRDLHKGYLKGLEFKIEQDASPMEKKAILGMLCTAWPLVVECDNVADLNRQLNAMLRYESVIDPQAKRLAGICYEIGLKLADRGRPKKS